MSEATPDDGLIDCLLCRGSKRCPVCLGVPMKTTPSEPLCMECDGSGKCAAATALAAAAGRADYVIWLCLVYNPG